VQSNEATIRQVHVVLDLRPIDLLVAAVTGVPAPEAADQLLGDVLGELAGADLVEDAGS
jgi:hypothetical protein